MTRDLEVVTEASYIIALTKFADRYVAAADSMPTDIEGAFKFTERSLRTHSVEARVVELHGRLHFATIYIDRSTEAKAYVLTDDDMLPLGIESNRTPVSGVLEGHWARIFRDVETADALNPRHQLPISNSFVQPTLVLNTPEFGDKGTRLQWSEMGRFARALLVGAPGAGKTTALRRFIHDELVRSNPEDAFVPVYIQARTLSPAALRAATLGDLLGDAAEGKRATQALAEVAQHGRLLLAIDGLDEMTRKQRQQLIDRLGVWCKQYPLMSVVISSRNLAELDQLSGYTRLELEPFSRAQLHEWIMQNSASKGALKAFQAALESRNDMSELARSPLVLYMLHELFEEHGILPTNRRAAIDHFSEAYLWRWDRARSVDRWENDVSRDDLIRWLEGIALEEWTSECLNRPVVYGSTRHEVVDRCEGVLRWHDSESRPQFQHRLFRDYFAAKAVAESGDARALLIERLPRYDDVWLFACGAASNADDLVRPILQNQQEPLIPRAALIGRLFEDRVVLSKSVRRDAVKLLADALALIFDEAGGGDHGYSILDVGDMMAVVGPASSDVEHQTIEDIIRSITNIEHDAGREMLASELEKRGGVLAVLADRVDASSGIPVIRPLGGHGFTERPEWG